MKTSINVNILKLLDEVMVVPRNLLLILAACVGALAAAYIAQYGFDLQPCILCLWQRVPFALAITFMAVALFKTKRPDTVFVMLVLSSIAMLFDAGLAFFHSGVELHWWSGTVGCVTEPVAVGETSLDVEALRNALMQKAVNDCDKITWTLLGFSMANWSVPFALGLSAFSALSAYVLKTGRKFSGR